MQAFPEDSLSLMQSLSSLLESTFTGGVALAPAGTSARHSGEKLLSIRVGGALPAETLLLRGVPRLSIKAQWLYSRGLVWILLPRVWKQ